jgi:hypothetical protein
LSRKAAGRTDGDACLHRLYFPPVAARSEEAGAPINVEHLNIGAPNQVRTALSQDDFDKINFNRKFKHNGCTQPTRVRTPGLTSVYLIKAEYSFSGRRRSR